MTDRAPLGIVAAPPGWSVRIVDESPSTNADLLDDPATPDGAVLVAEFQSAGRGRLDRSWTSPPRAGLTVSVGLRPTPPSSTWSWLPLLAGVALCDAVGPAAALKWPNDLLLDDGGKAAGILVQSAAGLVVVGMGVNVSTTAAELPGPGATSLALADLDDDRTALLEQLLTALAERYRDWTAAGGDADRSGLRAAYLARCATLGADVVVARPSGPITGAAVDIDHAGRLVVATARGRRALSAGDVTHVRPAGR